jgi:hypothetical protein
MIKNNRTIKAIPTKYEGVVFRSRMEARFAKWCGSWGIKWLYEPEGYEFDGEHYLPDFYLPESDILVEVKPIVAKKEAFKIKKLMNCLGANDWEEHIDGSDDLYYKNRKEAWVVQVDTRGCTFISGQIDYSWYDTLGEGEHIGPVLCAKCKKPYLIGYAIWDCRHCGNYDGDHSFTYREDWGYFSEQNVNFAPYGDK